MVILCKIRPHHKVAHVRSFFDVEPLGRRQPNIGRKQIRFFTSRLINSRGKRLLDITAAATFLVLFSPLMFLIALSILAYDFGRPIFWQKRVGRWGREFWFPKFRTMVPNAEKLLPSIMNRNKHAVGVTFKMKDDPRLTWIGRILRRTSMDELPQLWCILQGHMSLVGPRPAVPREVGQYTLEDRQRLEAIPGLTCIWQVSGRSNIPFPQQVEMDLEYIQSCSLALDVMLLLKTVPAVLSGRGAY